MKTNEKSQSAVEFIILASFMLLVVVIFFALTSSKVLEAKEKSNKQTAEDIATFAYREIETALFSSDGYTRIFDMPNTINGIAYSIDIIDDRELVINYLDNEYVLFLPSNVSGDIKPGANEVKKMQGIVSLKNLVECNDQADNDLDGAIDLNDLGCSSPTDTDETDCGDSVCEGGEVCLSCASDCGSCPVTVLLMKSSTFNVIDFDSNGNAVLKGEIKTKPNPPDTASDEFIFKNSDGDNVAVIDLDIGKMTIRGSLFENQPVLSPSPSENDFIIKDPGSNVVSYIDESGNFYLKGTLTQNGNP